MPLMIEKLNTSTAVGAAGLFIPQADLVGVTAAEMTTSTPDSKIALGLLEGIYTKVTALTNKLGVSVSKANPTGVGNNLITQNYSAVFTNVVNLRTLAVSQLPLNAANFGIVTVANLFPGASIVAATDTPGKGIVLPFTSLASYGSGPAISNVNTSDARSTLQALYFMLVDELDVGNGVVSTGKSNIAATTPSANFTGTGAITGLAAADLPYRAFYTITYNATIRLKLNQSNQTFDVDVD